MEFSDYVETRQHAAALDGTEKVVMSQGGEAVEATTQEIADLGGGGGHVIEDEGTPLPQRTKLNFVGSGVDVTDDSGDDATVVTISAGVGTPGGSDTQVQYNNAGSFGGISGATTNGTILSLTTPAPGTNTTQAANTAFVQTEILNSLPANNLFLYYNFY